MQYCDPLIDQLDVHRVVHHRLFQQSCYRHGGDALKYSDNEEDMYVKDLSQLGRDLESVIILDNSPTSYLFHPQHALPISSWFSDAFDEELLDLIPVLEDLAGERVRDISMVLDVSLAISPATSLLWSTKSPRPTEPILEEFTISPRDAHPDFNLPAVQHRSPLRSLPAGSPGYKHILPSLNEGDR